MKRRTTLLLAVILCLSLEACGIKAELVPNVQEIQPQATAEKKTEETQTESSKAAVPVETTETVEKAAETREEPISLNYELIGPWHLDQNRNDLAAFSDSLDLFPGYGEWGASMEIRGNGEMSWYIGAEGWHGTYSVEENTLHALLTSDLEQATQSWDFRITSDNGIAGLEMDYKDMTIYWVYGDQEEADTVPSNWEKATEDEPWQTALAEDLFAKYGVLPEYYEDLGDGIYQVYVEIGGELVPFVAVNSATGDYHG